MLKNILLLALMSCTLMALGHAGEEFGENMFDRLKNRVIHVETLEKRGYWLAQNGHTDDDGSYYFDMKSLDIRDTYYAPKVQYQTSVCGGGKYLCLESLSLLNSQKHYYLAAGYPAGAGGTMETVKLSKSSYIEDDDKFHWTIECVDSTLEDCLFLSRRFNDNWHMIRRDDGASLGTDRDKTHAHWRVHAPNPTDGMNQIYENTNEGTTDQLVKYKLQVGVSQTQTTINTVTNSVSIEVGAAFKAFSASASSNIEDSWTTTDSTTYEASKTVEHDITLEARATTRLMQLKGNYDGEFTVGDEKYDIKVEPLDSGPTRIYHMRITKDGKVETLKKEEL